MRKRRQHPPSALRHATSRRRRRRRGGFTLIEAALTTVIVGTGVLAIVAAQQAYHMKNDWAQRTGTALLLANELRELTLSLPVHDPIVGTDPSTGAVHVGPEPGELGVADYDDLDDFAGPIGVDGFGAGITFGNGGDQPGPINALRQVIPKMENWSQTITVVSVPKGEIDTTYTMALDAPDTFKRVTVTVHYQGPHDDEPQAITDLTWLITD